VEAAVLALADGLAATLADALAEAPIFTFADELSTDSPPQPANTDRTNSEPITLSRIILFLS
jgi:hypothetical protein